MGIEVIRLKNELLGGADNLTTADLAKLEFHEYAVPTPELHIWTMSVEPDRLLFPWWKFDSALFADMQSLSDVWNVTNAQSLFDCLFLFLLRASMGPHTYVIFPGSIRRENWGQVRESDQQIYLRGQGCLYHLHGSFNKRMEVNWVPYWQPQSLVKDPPFLNMWRLFVQSQADDVSKNLSFFQLADSKRLPEVVNLLIEKDDKRSEKLAAMVDWFGVYSSPLQDNYLPGSIIYSKNKVVIEKFKMVQTIFQNLVQEMQTEMLKDAKPQAILRFLSRHIKI